MILLAAAVALCSVLPLSVQAGTRQAGAAAAAAGPERPPEQDRRAAPQTASPPAAKVKRWVDWQVGSIETRYRWIENSAGVETSNQLQHKQSIKGAFKFDPEGKYTLQAMAGTGGSFVSSWENTGLGMGSPAWAFNLRQLYLQAAPARGVEGAWGGMTIARGEHTEITTFDNDNYLMAGRVALKRPDDLYFDEISLTAGHLGDLPTPNVFRRFDRWDEHNYSQVLLSKKFGQYVTASADWTDIEHVSTLRQAVRVDTRRWLPVDAVRFENYQLVEGDEAWGFAMTADKSIHPRVQITGGYADIDPVYGVLNGDRYSRGRRLFVEPRFTIIPELAVSLFYGEAVNNDLPVSNEHRFDVVVTYNVIRAIQRTGAW